MHTFFINTTGKELKKYSDILEVQHETRRLVSLECPLAEWNDAKKGYKACVRRMGELIDSYKDINNDFNLILYIDLLAYEEYTSIPMNKHLERHACLKALRSILKHYIKATIVDEMNNWGRVPREILLIFEENQQPMDEDETTDEGKDRIRKYARIFLGIPADFEIDEILNKYIDVNAETSISPEQFIEEAEACRTSSIGRNILDKYKDQIDLFLEEIQNRDTFEIPLKLLLDRIIDSSSEDDKTIASVSFVTNRRAGIANKQENTRRILRLCFYVLECINAETVFENTPLNDYDPPTVKDFPDLDWEKAATGLIAKGSIFQKKYHETDRLSDSYSELKLAPTLYSFDNQRFALDEHGQKRKIFSIVDAGESKDEVQEAKDIDEGIVRSNVKKAVEINEEHARNLFNDKYPAFNYKGDDFDDSLLSSKATAEQYIEEAQKLRQHHLDYLKRLKVHVSERLSNYAGRSAENKPALLRKRKVSVGEEDFEDTERDYRYAESTKKEETKPLETVEEISRMAYTSTLVNYMEFCSGRSVAVTDIEEQCNWFITRVHQIKESLRKIKLVAIGLLIAIIILYVPFVVIQWESITKNVITLNVALVSIAIPLILLYIIFLIVSLIQRKKYRKVWKEFKEKSDMTLKENAVAAEKYDHFLSVYVPGLRWVYEYKLDVEFYADCCKMARAKIEHHLQKLRDRVITVGNIIEDLEADASEREQGQITARARNNINDEIDYNVSFCTGENNRAFYSIIDTHFLESVHR